LKSKKILVLTLTVMLMFSCISFAFAAPNVNPSANPDLIKSTATNIAENIVGVVQGVFWCSRSLFCDLGRNHVLGASGDPNKIAMAKKHLPVSLLL